jgi:hypothetical protein
LSCDPEWFAGRTLEAGRRPWTVLMRCGGRLEGAVQMQEKTFAGLPLGYFTASNAAGDEFVIAPAGREDEVLRRCVAELARRIPGAIFFLTTSRDYGFGENSEWKQRTSSSVARYRLRLLPDWDETLMQFGSHTRRNLRYYPRHLLAQGWSFHPELSYEEADEAGTHLRLHNRYRMTGQALEIRERAARRQPGYFAAGLRSDTGEWAGYIAGWRSAGKTHIFFQMNHDGFRRASVSTAIRALLMRHEIELGATEMIFVYYTTAVFERGCLRDSRYDLLLGRMSWRRKMMSALVPMVLPPEHRLRICLEGRPEAGTEVTA